MHSRSTVLHKGLDPENGVVSEPEPTLTAQSKCPMLPCRWRNLNGAMTAWGWQAVLAPMPGKVLSARAPVPFLRLDHVISGKRRLLLLCCPQWE